MEESKKEGKPFFLWWNSTRMHIFTHLKPESQGKTGFGIYPDGMVEHDAMVGHVLDKLKELGLDSNTIVMYSTDNGAEKFTWPDGGQSPFRGEKNTNWEGGYRVPTAIRWPGVTKPGTVLNDVFAHEDMLPTLLAAAGDPSVKEKLLKGMRVGAKTFKVHLDGYNSRTRWRGNRRVRATSSSILMTKGRSSAFATISGKSSSPSNVRRASTSGRNRSYRCASRSSSTCAQIPSRPPTMKAWTMNVGAWSAPFCSCLHSNTLVSSSPPSRNSRRAKSPAASASIRRSRRSRAARGVEAGRSVRDHGVMSERRVRRS
jgi:hypothetical protein